MEGTDFLFGGAHLAKQKSYFNDFCVGLVKNGRSHLVHKTLKSAE